MKYKFRVNGMTCAACSARVESVSSKVPGVKCAEVNLMKGTMVADLEQDAAAQLVIDAIKKAGYDAALYEDKKISAEGPNPLAEMKQRIVFSAIFLSILMYFTMGHMVGLPLTHWLHDEKNAVVSALFQLTLTLPVVF